MKLEIKHIDGKKFEAFGGGGSFVIDPTVITPLEYFGLGLISCSGVDIVAMAEKNSIEVKSFSMSMNGVRNEDFPKKFNSAEILYKIDCNADETMVKRWVMSSIETYCSTINTLRNCVDLTYTIIQNGVEIVKNAKISKVGVEYMTEDIGGCCN